MDITSNHRIFQQIICVRSPIWDSADSYRFPFRICPCDASIILVCEKVFEYGSNFSFSIIFFFLLLIFNFGWVQLNNKVRLVSEIQSRLMLDLLCSSQKADPYKPRIINYSFYHLTAVWAPNYLLFISIIMNKWEKNDNIHELLWKMVLPLIASGFHFFNRISVHRFIALKIVLPKIEFYV